MSTNVYVEEEDEDEEEVEKEKEKKKKEKTENIPEDGIEFKITKLFPINWRLEDNTIGPTQY
ncbi:hypothetical protein V1477_008865 [Vespula maculifrons]|uniref:Uncharacterized protein n=1 Tax=Vespula maculifrons TaxID=7453 RepID=A0ABD2CE79_VESMC